MWGEGASDLFGRLQEEEHERELETMKREREPLEDDAKPTDRETDEALGAAGLNPV
ncbi:MAG TPA: hypothetical protein VEP28_12490 [Rubrobacter sp.]|nr:hypothetical protein [Rubrobacter sp.]